jgi:hypothetical protein
VPAEAVFCTTADRFSAYLRQPPVLVLETTIARLRRKSKVVFTLNKISTVTLTLARRGKPVYARTARFGYGRHAFAVRPRDRGTLRASLRAVDAAGNAGAVEGVIQVRRAK